MISPQEARVSSFLRKKRETAIESIKVNLIAGLAFPSSPARTLFFCQCSSVRDVTRLCGGGLSILREGAAKKEEAQSVAVVGIDPAISAGREWGLNPFNEGIHNVYMKP